mmetsp:Transcript_79381/g.220894  ORF Transcript_79381/g.220894 Transcript_79381/m.220894 type:complete len:597 (+) Transcript_79381:153-1943(+)
MSLRPFTGVPKAAASRTGSAPFCSIQPRSACGAFIADAHSENFETAALKRAPRAFWSQANVSSSTSNSVCSASACVRVAGGMPGRPHWSTSFKLAHFSNMWLTRTRSGLALTFGRFGGGGATSPGGGAAAASKKAQTPPTASIGHFAPCWAATLSSVIRSAAAFGRPSCSCRRRLTSASLSKLAPSARSAKAYREPGVNCTVAVSMPVVKTVAGALRSQQPRARVTNTASSSGVGVHNVVPRTTASSAMAKISRPCATLAGQTFCNRPKAEWYRWSTTCWIASALLPSGTPRSLAAAAGSAARGVSSLAFSTSASKSVASASALNMASTSPADRSSLANTAMARCLPASATLSGCTTRDFRRKSRLMAAGPSRNSALAMLSAAKGFVALDTRNISRACSWGTASNSAKDALLGRTSAAAVSSSHADMAPPSNCRPADATRRRSSLLASVCCVPPTTAMTLHDFAGADETVRVLAELIAGDSGAGGLQRTQRVPPKAPMTSRAPTSSATATLQPAKRTGESKSWPSSAVTESWTRSSSSKSSHSVALELSRGSSSAWSRFAQNSAAVPMLRNPSKSRKSAAGLSKKSSGCFNINPVL